jgi:imidazole glycerol-phosphate synthase subunit HisH
VHDRHAHHEAHEEPHAAHETHAGHDPDAFRRQFWALLALTIPVVAWSGEGRPLLGICVGMQLLYEHSEEGDTPCLGVLPGRVVRISGEVRVPHMGWNVLDAQPGREDDPLLQDIAGAHAYFVHSYRVVPATAEQVLATTAYGATIPAIVRSGSVVATQFHPEKSADVGVRFLENWRSSLLAGVGR